MGRAAHAAVLAGLAAPALLASGCGGSTRREVAQTSTDKYAASLAYSRCMRSHGLPNFPDPKQVGGTIQISGSRTGIDPRSPAYASARQACKALLPAGAQPTQVRQQQALARMLRVSRCMRAHGIPGFPDPTLSPPAQRGGYSRISSNGVAWLAVPSSIDVGSPAFERAAAACGF
jgi:hypothetical protein